MPARHAAAFLLILTAGAIRAVSAQGTDLSLSPYASFLAPTGKSPLAGLSLSLAGSPGFALRLNGRTALRNTSPDGVAGHASIPPWGADVDAVFALSGAPFGPARTGATYGFVGRGMAGADTAEMRVVTQNWSYGVGTVLPLGSSIDLFADSRWRMRKFVLPTAKPHPEKTKEIRFGVTLHVHGTSSGGGGWRGR
jgi:hypothetical protein